MGFLAAILGFLGELAGPLLKLFIQTPPAVAVEDQKLGQAQVTAATDAQAAKTEAAIAQAGADRPTSQQALVDEMKKGDY